MRAIDADGAIWGAPVIIESPSENGRDTSLTVVNGNPAISYYDRTDGGLKYVRANDIDGTVWSTPVVVDSLWVRSSTQMSLAVVDGHPAISYMHSTHQDLRYVRANDADGTAWGTPVVVDSSAYQTGYYSTLAVVNGSPAISYCDLTNGDLKYAHGDSVPVELLSFTVE